MHEIIGPASTHWHELKEAELLVGQFPRLAAFGLVSDIVTILMTVTDNCASQ